MLIWGKQISYIDIDLFSDASLTKVCTVAYAGGNQQNMFSEKLTTSKSTLERKSLSMPRLELVPTYVSANFNLNKLCIRNIYAWSDNTTVLHWLKDKEDYKTLFNNSVFKIKGEKFYRMNIGSCDEKPSPSSELRLWKM